MSKKKDEISPTSHAQKRAGRPRSEILDPGLKDRLLQAVRMGNTLKDAAALNGLNQDTFKDIRKRDPEFDAAVAAALVGVTRQYLDVIHDIAVKPYAKPADRLAAAKWMAEKRDPDQYGQRQRLEVEARSPEKMSTEELVAETRELLQRIEAESEGEPSTASTGSGPESPKT